MNYYERYVGDYQRDTAHLSLAEHGAYTMLLDTYYATESALPADYPSLCRICRAYGAAEQKAVKVVADQFFPVGEDGLRHNWKADEIIPDALKRIETARTNGKNGGRPPKSKTEIKPAGLLNENPAGLQNETQQCTQRQSSPTPEVKELKPLSGRPDVAEVLDYLNLKAGRAYQHVDANLRLIAGRLAGSTVDQCKAVIDARVAKWLGDKTMDEYLRPKTLFNATNFAQYVGELGASKTAGIDGQKQDPRFAGCR